MRLIVFIGCISLLASCSFMMPPVKGPVKKSVYNEVDMEEMIRRYIAKTHGLAPTIEGIYSVSGLITKKGRTFLSSEIKERVMVRQDNYARVAILKDWPGSNTEYVELSLDEKNAPRYPIVAELTELAGGGGFIYKHFEPKGDVYTFTFLYDTQNPDILEGVYSKTKNGAEITYKLTYLRVYPKGSNYQNR